MRDWDRSTSARVDSYASISKFIADRVKRAYGRDSIVIYPPVDTDFYAPFVALPGGTITSMTTSGQMMAPYYVTASRFVPYKRIDLIVRAFAGERRRRLIVIGDGPDDAKVRAAAVVDGAPASNVEFVGHANREKLRDLVRGSRAFVFAAEEDFGIAPVEAQACGVPVIAYGKGGVLETIVGDGPAPTGVFFKEQTVESLRDALTRYEASSIDPAACRANAERFSAARFRAALAEWVTAAT